MRKKTATFTSPKPLVNNKVTEKRVTSIIIMCLCVCLRVCVSVCCGLTKGGEAETRDTEGVCVWHVV